MDLGSRIVLLASILASGSLLGAQTVKLAGDFPPAPGGGDALELRVSPDGTRVVYRADQDTHGVFELYAAPADGSAPPVKLSGPMAEEGDASEGGFAFSPDGAWIVYRADQAADQVFELFGVPSDGSGPPVRLNATLPPGGDVGETGSRGFEIAPDSTRVVYWADQTVDEQRELWSVPIDGSSAPVKLNGTVFSFSSPSLQIGASDRVVFRGFAPAHGFEILSAPIDGSAEPLVLSQFTSIPSVGLGGLTADGSRALYVSAQTSPVQDQRLWIVPVDGSSAPVLLTPTSIRLIAGALVSPDGSRAAYLASLSGAFEWELFSVPLDASASPVRLHAPFPAGRTVVVGQVALSSDSARALFVADADLNDVYELWSAPLDGSAAPLRLNAALAPGKDVNGVFGVARVASSARVVYQADGDLFSVPADGSGAAQQLNAPLVPFSGVHPYSNDLENPAQPFGDDTTRVVFALNTFDGVSELVTELYGVPIDGSATPVKLSGTLTPGGSVATELGWGFAGTRVLFFADQDTEEVFELFSTPIDGGPGLAKLNGPMSSSPPESAFSRVTFTQDGSRALFLLRFEGQTEDELYSVPTDGSAAAVRLHAPLPPHRAVENFLVSPDGTRVVIVVYDDGSLGGGGFFVYSAPTDGSTPEVAFDASMASGTLAITSDGAYLVARGSDERVFRAPLDASAPGVPLTSAPAAPELQWIRKLVLSPDGSQVVFVQDRDVAGVVELYRVPVDGSAPATKLNPVLVANGDVGWVGANAFSVLVSPDSSRVVYLADQDVDERFELYSVPLAGGTAIKLNGSLVAGGDVFVSTSTGPILSPDGSRVVYVADQLVDARYELFSVPIGGGTAVKLNGALVANGSVYPFEAPLVDATSQRVVYRADAAVDEQFELYSVPLAGGTAVRLNGNLVLHGDVVGQPQISPDGTWVVYEADQELDGRLEVYSRRSDGSGALRKLSAPLPAGGHASGPRISADGRRVVYLGDQAVDERYELFKVPISGGPAQRLNPPLVTGGDVFGFVLSPDGTLVLHHGDEETNGMAELYATGLEGGGSGRQGAAAGPPASTTTVGPVAPF